jgi:hypothetical protein
MAKKTYTAEQKANALILLATNKGNLARTARDTGLPRKTISAWAKGKHIQGVTPEIMQSKTDEIVEKLDRNIALYLEAGADEVKIAKASLKDISIAMAVSLDKKQLLMNRPTQIMQTSQTDRARIEASIRLVMQECLAQGVEIGVGEAARLLKQQLPNEPALDEFIEGELLEEPKALLAA